MKTRYLFPAATALIAACGAMLAQTPQGAGIVYQQAGVITSFQTGAAGGGVVRDMGLPGMGSEVLDLAGSPLSATQQSHSLQVLGDGTRIERSESQQIYRDSMGRTRIENGPSAAGTVIIQDPVGGVTLLLDPVAKTAQKAGPAIKARIAMGDAETKVIRAGVVIRQANALASSKPVVDPVVEDFPAQNVNGVLATGHKTTLTIPAGEIGNDRPIQVVSETWYSSDLQMMVKSSNSDPRFGETSFELTNITRNEPDPSLFQVPADYVVSDPKPVKFRTAQP
jgi:hypothetical protein